jgi:hypothetical protein
MPETLSTVAVTGVVVVVVGDSEYVVAISLEAASMWPQKVLYLTCTQRRHRRFFSLILR